MQLQVVDKADQVTRGLQVQDKVFAREFNMSLVHQVVTSYLAGGRAGTQAQKSRSEVSGSTAKPWRQKGTGRARAGTAKSPIWRHGGVTFAAKPRDYQQKVNKKMYRAALCVIISELVRAERLVLVESIALEAPRTKVALEHFGQLLQGKTLIVGQAIDSNLFLAVRNLVHVDVCDVVELDPVSLVNADRVLLAADALPQLEERLA